MTRPLAMTLASAALAACLLAPASTASLVAPLQEAVPFESLGRGFLEKHCDKDATVETCLLEEVLARDFASLRLGAFELHYPAGGLGVRERAGELTDIARGVLDLQGRLLAWMALEPGLEAGLTADISTLRAWVEGWKAADLARLGRIEDKRMLSALEAPDAVRKAAERLEQALGDREQLGVAPQYVDGVGVLLCPTRREFMEVIGYLGLADPQWRDQHWVEGADQWTQCWQGPLLVLALEYAPWTGFDSQFLASLSPTRLDKGGLLQHVLNQAARALLFRLFNRPELAHLERSLAAGLVIETVGRIMVLDGEGVIRSSGGTTQPYERFIPGGNPNGGVLPPISASPLDTLVSSRWRAGKGEDWFVGVLSAGQKAAVKVAKKDKKNPNRKDKLAHFLLDSDEDGEAWLVSAPFLGALAAEQEYPPAEYLNDFREFFKSYQTAFYRWLRTEGVAGSPQESASRFHAFLRTLGTPGNSDAPEVVLERVYEVPMSARDGSTDSLEWRFLRWLGERG